MTFLTHRRRDAGNRAAMVRLLGERNLYAIPPVPDFLT